VTALVGSNFTEGGGFFSKEGTLDVCVCLSGADGRGWWKEE
jgi:hypothetical protein